MVIPLAVQHGSIKITKTSAGLIVSFMELALEMKVEIPDGICVTYSSQEDEYYGGSCPFRHTETNNSRYFSELPTVPDQVNHTMCAPYNRKGFLCGKCIGGYGPAVYSLDMKCSNCSHLSMGYAITLFLSLELFPSTILFIFLVVFRLNITVGPLLGYVIFCQVYAFYQIREMFIYEYLRAYLSTRYKTLFEISLTISQIWSMQFLKLYIPSFCISDRLTDIHIQMLSLVKTIYPIVLVIITCILMELHARNYRIIHILCKPLVLVFNKINITSDAMFHGLASFNCLSATNVTYSVCILLVHSLVYRSSDCSLNRRILFFDTSITSITWFSKEHTRFLVPTLILFILLVLLPLLLLCIYPTRIYRYIVRFISARKRLAITAFAEALNKCFKDGLNGTRDYRGLPGLLLICVFYTRDYFHNHSKSKNKKRTWQWYYFDPNIADFLICATL